MILIFTAVGVLLFPAGLYLWLIHPDTSRRKDCLAFRDWNFAHRGLWDMSLGIPENSLPAFARAVEHGYAIELDIHLTKDGRMVVFHDEFLPRMCGVAGMVEKMNSEDLRTLYLAGTPYHMPYLSEVLDLVDGKVPLLLELKLPFFDTKLCEVFYSQIVQYNGKILVETFNPFGLYWFRKKHPEILRGQLSTRHAASIKSPLILKYLSTSLMIHLISRPHFVAYHYEDSDVTGFWINHKLFHVPTFIWTIRNEKDYQDCRKKFDCVIFEKFIPTQEGNKKS